MKKIICVLSVFFVFGLTLVSVSFAQRGQMGKWQGSGGWGPDAPYQRLYDPAKVETITGTVESVERIKPDKGMYPAVTLTVKTEKETILVHLGPAWYIGRLDTKIEKGDKLEIKGSRVTFNGKPVIIAAEIKKGESTLVLRDSDGIPVWAGWRRK